MKPKRIKQPAVKICTRAEAEAMVCQIAFNVDVQIATNALINDRIRAIRAEYASLLNEAQADTDAYTELLQLWAAANPAEFKGTRKGMESDLREALCS